MKQNFKSDCNNLLKLAGDEQLQFCKKISNKMLSKHSSCSFSKLVKLIYFKNIFNKIKHFTLIELIIVISIIAILTSILLPALNKARESAKRIVCAGMMRQMSTSIALYATDYEEWLPPVGSGNQQWMKKIWPYYCGKSESNYSLYKSDNNKYLECPSLDTKLLPNAKFRIKLTYGPTQQYWSTNHYDAAGSPKNYGGYIYHNTPGAYKKLANVTPGTVLLIEKHLTDDPSYYLGGLYIRPWDYNLAIYTNTKNIKLGAAWRHNSSSNFLFPDGSIKPYRHHQKFKTDWKPKGI